jgi:hypothetical protein
VVRVESHGGYLFRADELDPELLMRLARRALALDGHGFEDVSLVVGVLASQRIVRLAFDAPFTYGRRGARWYCTHHSLARLVSRELRTTVHVYVHDDGELEQVITFGDGQEVGGESLDLREWEPPDDEDLEEVDLEKHQDAWPIGRLGRVYGVSREALLRMARYARSALLHLDAPVADELEALQIIWPAPLPVLGAG